jgi:hypothetical protein
MFSHKKGQSALEYLMTYGCALVVIVVVIAALVVLVGNPGGSDTCNAPGSTFSVSNQDMNTTGWTLKVSNLTGRTLNSVTAIKVFWSPSDVNSNPSKVIVPSIVNTGQEFTLAIGLDAGTMTPGKKYQSIMTLQYNDGDFTRTADVTCNGTA